MQRILIANRGEIAVRIARACADAGYQSIAVYSDQDFGSMHTRVADEAYALNGDTAATSYLDIERILDVAERSKADAIHPGYGFISESADFSRAVEEAGITFIGPTADTLEQLGDKVTARKIAATVGAPLVPGIDRPLKDAREAYDFAAEFGLPVAIKAAFGGGGRGLKIVRRMEEVVEAFESATREAVAAFGRGECYIEKFIDRPRHIEAQIIGDGQGNVVVIGDRDCSMQRRNQKLIEEAPAPDLGAELRKRIHDAAKDIGTAVKYRGAGTVEFLLGEDSQTSFLEVNTRLQVEHPVTEMVTGVDLVAEQFRIAEGRGLSVADTPEPDGHAFEFRINAEDPGRGFLPSPGKITTLQGPGGPGVRWDAGVQSGDHVVEAFDSMIAKLVVFGDSRQHALTRSRRALAEIEVEGVATVIPFDKMVLEHKAFTASPVQTYTQWIEEELLPELPSAPRSNLVSEPQLERVYVEIDGRRVEIRLPDNVLAGVLSTDRVAISTPPQSPYEDTDKAALRSPVSGSLARQLVTDGARVSKGEPVAVCEAMKTETTIYAHKDGTLSWVIEENGSIKVDEALAKIGD